MAFPPNVAFGEISALPHHKPGNRALQKNEHVLLDVGVKLDHYASDKD